MRRATPKDLGLALLAAFLVAQGPLTSPALAPSLAGGLLAAGAVLYFRLRRAPNIDALEPAEGAEIAPRWDVPSGVWVSLFALAVCLASTWTWMYDQWTSSVWHNTHGLLIPPLVLMLGRNILRRMEPADDPASAWGFALLIPGLLLIVLDTAAATRYMASFGFVLTLPGLTLLLLGPLRTRALALPLVLAFFMVPVPNTFATQTYLRTATADGVGWILNLMGISTLVENSMLQLPHSTFLVATACSGFATLVASVAMAILVGALCHSWKRRVLIAVATLPLAFAANVVRVTSLVLISVYVDKQLLDTTLHGVSGAATFLVVLFILALLADRPSLGRALL